MHLGQCKGMAAILEGKGVVAIQCMEIMMSGTMGKRFDHDQR